MKKKDKILNKWWQGYVQKGNLVILLGMETGTAIAENSIKILQNIKKTTTLQGLPWWCNGWEPTCHCRGHAFDLGSRRILHAVEQLTLSVTTTKPECCSYRSPGTQSLCSATRSHSNEKAVHCNENSPCSPQLEGARTKQRRPSAAINKWKSLKKENFMI